MSTISTMSTRIREDIDLNNLKETITESCGTCVSKRDRFGKVSVRLNMILMKNLIMDDVSAWRRLFTTNPWLLALRWSPIQVLSQHDESYQ